MSASASFESEVPESVPAQDLTGHEGPAGDSSADVRQAAPTVGQRLRAEREQRGLSVAEVARQLKLAPRQVEALESDDHAALPGDLFVRGFLRNYARLFDFDPGAFGVSMPVGALTQAPGQPPDACSAAAGPSPSLAIAVRRRMRREPRAARTRVVAALVVVLAVALAAVALLDPRPSQVSPLQPSGAMPGGAGAGLAPAAPEDSPGALAAARSGEPAAATLPATAPGFDARLQLRFARDAWVEVRDEGGNVIFSQLSRTGSTQELTGRPPFQLVVGNASGVELSYRGKPVDLAPHTRSDVARLTLE